MIAPAFLLRFLPHIAIALAVIGAVWFLDRQGYQRATRDRAASDAALVAKITAKLGEIDVRNAARLASIDTTERTIVQPILRTEIAREARYNDSRCAITPGVRDALNTAVAASGATSADRDAVPPVAPAGG